MHWPSYFSDTIETTTAALAQLVEHLPCKEVVRGSRPLCGSTFFRRVTELGYVLALDARFCGFEPHPAYHFYKRRKL